MKVPYTKSGKCGIMVYQRARYGQICYLAFIPINPRTPDQVHGREAWRAVNGRWPTLTQEQMVRWNAAAEKINSKLHLTQGKLTGEVLFVKNNYSLAYWGREQFDEPPRKPRFPELAVAGFLVTNVADIIRISLDCPTDPGERIILRASAPLNAGRKTCTQFRIIGICPPPDQGFADITACYTAKFGVPRVGSKIFLRVNQMIDGWQDKPVEFTFVVPAPQAEPVLGRPATHCRKREAYATTQAGPVLSRPTIVMPCDHGWTEMDTDQQSEVCGLTLGTESTDMGYMGGRLRLASTVFCPRIGTMNRLRLRAGLRLRKAGSWKGAGYMGYVGYTGWRGCTATGTGKGREWGLGVSGSGVFCLKRGHGDGGDPPLIPECYRTAIVAPRQSQAGTPFRPP
jgi:hypothetical protein